MSPTLKARAAQCTSGRDVPAETIREFQEAGFFRILQPRRWGGYGVTLDAGNVILSGSLVPLDPARKGDTFEMMLHGMGGCAARFV